MRPTCPLGPRGSPQPLLTLPASHFLLHPRWLTQLPSTTLLMLFPPPGAVTRSDTDCYQSTTSKLFPQLGFASPSNCTVSRFVSLKKELRRCLTHMAHTSHNTSLKSTTAQLGGGRKQVLHQLEIYLPPPWLERGSLPYLLHGNFRNNSGATNLRKRLLTRSNLPPTSSHFELTPHGPGLIGCLHLQDYAIQCLVPPRLYAVRRWTVPDTSLMLS